MDSKDREVSFEIASRLGVLGAGSKGWSKELNLVSWNGREAKLDIREWSPDHQKMGKGTTLTREEAAALRDLLSSYLGS
ncbi:MAG TPA: PC4/YdbC family ssDNA-binding protein [Spirochaetales bacterium]|nr:PC4/YdbC family ssDNA-binding protein [Spirochaetales bacterium]HRY55928.1 PC4/YdbC family ssDNA-binding protein [Spirochaetia bacterium]HRZ65072.1 PC4/YdbC family ssDNA-binding protein [Spirochaetia bacterium]